MLRTCVSRCYEVARKGLLCSRAILLQPSYIYISFIFFGQLFVYAHVLISVYLLLLSIYCKSGIFFAHTSNHIMPHGLKIKGKMFSTSRKRGYNSPGAWMHFWNSLIHDFNAGGIIAIHVPSWPFWSHSFKLVICSVCVLSVPSRGLLLS